MQRTISLRTDITATGLAALTAAAVVIAPIAPATAQASLPAVVHDIRLTAASVPPGALITSFLHNQTVYCSIICPPARPDRGDGRLHRIAGTGNFSGRIVRG